MQDQIHQDLKNAMKAGDSLKLGVLRMLVSELNYKKIETQRELQDADVMAVLQKEAKKRREAIDSYTAGGRSEQAKQEQDELVVLQAYLPSQLTEDQVRAELVGMNLPKDFPMAMKLASPAFRNRADGGLVARLVKELIA